MSTIRLDNTSASSNVRPQVDATPQPSTTPANLAPGVFDGTVPARKERRPADHSRVSAMAGRLGAEGATAQQHALEQRVAKRASALIGAANRMRNTRVGTTKRARFDRNVAQVAELLVAAGCGGELSWEGLRDFTHATQVPSRLRDALWRSFDVLGRADRGSSSVRPVQVRRDAVQEQLQALWTGDSAAKRAIARL